MILSVGSRYSFNVYPSMVIGNNFTNVEVLSIMDAISASSYADIIALNEAVKPYLPSGTVTDPMKLTYVRVATSIGTKVILAYDWINQATITEVVSGTIHVTVRNVSSADAVRIRDTLLRANYPDIEISIS